MDRTPATRSRPHDLRQQHPARAGVTRVRPDPDAWALAMDLAAGDAGLLEVRDGGLVIYVHNA